MIFYAIGVRLDEKSLYDTKIVKAFDHNYPNDWVYDPIYGKKLWKEENKGIISENKEIYVGDNKLSNYFDTYVFKKSNYIVIKHKGNEDSYFLICDCGMANDKSSIDGELSLFSLSIADTNNFNKLLESNGFDNKNLEVFVINFDY